MFARTKILWTEGTVPATTELHSKGTLRLCEELSQNSEGVDIVIVLLDDWATSAVMSSIKRAANNSRNILTDCNPTSVNLTLPESMTSKHLEKGDVLLANNMQNSVGVGGTCHFFGFPNRDIGVVLESYKAYFMTLQQESKGGWEAKIWCDNTIAEVYSTALNCGFPVDEILELKCEFHHSANNFFSLEDAKTAIRDEYETKELILHHDIDRLQKDKRRLEDAERIACDSRDDLLIRVQALEYQALKYKRKIRNMSLTIAALQELPKFTEKVTSDHDYPGAPAELKGLEKIQHRNDFFRTRWALDLKKVHKALIIHECQKRNMLNFEALTRRRMRRLSIGNAQEVEVSDIDDDENNLQNLVTMSHAVVDKYLPENPDKWLDLDSLIYKDPTAEESVATKTAITYLMAWLREEVKPQLIFLETPDSEKFGEVLSNENVLGIEAFTFPEKNSEVEKSYLSFSTTCGEVFLMEAVANMENLAKQAVAKRVLISVKPKEVINLINSLCGPHEYSVVDLRDLLQRTRSMGETAKSVRYKYDTMDDVDLLADNFVKRKSNSAIVRRMQLEGVDKGLLEFEQKQISLQAWVGVCSAVIACVAGECRFLIADSGNSRALVLDKETFFHTITAWIQQVTRVNVGIREPDPNYVRQKYIDPLYRTSTSYNADDQLWLRHEESSNLSPLFEFDRLSLECSGMQVNPLVVLEYVKLASDSKDLQSYIRIADQELACMITGRDTEGRKLGYKSKDNLADRVSRKLKKFMLPGDTTLIIPILRKKIWRVYQVRIAKTKKFYIDYFDSCLEKDESAITDLFMFLMTCIIKYKPDLQSTAMRPVNKPLCPTESGDAEGEVHFMRNLNLVSYQKKPGTGPLDVLTVREVRHKLAVQIKTQKYQPLDQFN